MQHRIVQWTDGRGIVERDYRTRAEAEAIAAILEGRAEVQQEYAGASGNYTPVAVYWYGVKVWTDRQ